MKRAHHLSRRGFLGKLGLGAAAATVAIETLAAAEPSETISMNAPTDPPRFIPVMLTAYKYNWSIDYDGVSRLTDYYLEAGATGFFANCLSSEMYHLDNEERLKLTRHVVKHCGGKIPVVASGSFGDNLEEKADFTKRMRDVGVDAVILITGHYAEREDNDSVFIRNLEKFTSLTSGVPLGTYECPSPYKRIITPAVMEEMVKSRRFIYHKDTTEDIAQIRKKIDMGQGSNLGVYNAHIGSAAESLRYGGAGLSPIAGNFYPEIISWMCTNAKNPAKAAEVDWLQEKLRVAEKKIGKQYQLGARYFLSKRGLAINPISRNTAGTLEAGQATVLNELLAELETWHERIGLV